MTASPCFPGFLLVEATVRSYDHESRPAWLKVKLCGRLLVLALIVETFSQPLPHFRLLCSVVLLRVVGAGGNAKRRELKVRPRRKIASFGAGGAGAAGSASFPRSQSELSLAASSLTADTTVAAMSTKITEIADKAACAAWCPVSSHPGLVALGSKVRLRIEMVEYKLYEHSR